MIQEKELKKYIKDVRGVSITHVANRLGCTRQHLGNVINGHIPFGKKLAIAFAAWSNDLYSAAELMRLPRVN